MNQLFTSATPLFNRLILLCALFLEPMVAHKPFVLDFLITNVSLFSTDSAARFYCLRFITVNSLGFQRLKYVNRTQETSTSYTFNNIADSYKIIIV